MSFRPHSTEDERYDHPSLDLPPPLTMGEAAQSLADFATRGVQRTPTGFPTIDNKCGAPSVGELSLVWARSSAGKSTFYLNVIAQTPEIPTLVVNMEMTDRRQAAWLLGMSTPLPVSEREIEEVLRDPEHPHHEEIAEELANLQERFPQLFFLSPNRPSVGDIEFAVQQLDDAGCRPMRVFIDHIGLMAVESESREGYQKITAGLHRLALERHLSIFALQQVKRSGGDGFANDGHVPITLGSGVYAGEADADFIYGLYRPDRNPLFAKSRESFEIAGKPDEYWRLRDEYEKVRNTTRLQVIKNRPYSELEQEGIVLKFDPYSKRLYEPVPRRR